MADKSIQDLIKQLNDAHDPFAINNAAEALKDAAEKGLDITAAVPALVKTLSLEFDEVCNLSESDINDSKKAGCIPLVLLYDTKNYTDLRLCASGMLWQIAEETADKGSYISALKIIKDTTAVFMKFYSGKKDRESLKEKRELLGKFIEATQKIHDKMNKGRKSFPVKRQQVKKALKAVI